MKRFIINTILSTMVFVCASNLFAYSPTDRGRVQQLTKDIETGKVKGGAIWDRIKALKISPKDENDSITQGLDRAAVVSLTNDGYEGLTPETRLTQDIRTGKPQPTLKTVRQPVSEQRKTIKLDGKDVPSVEIKITAGQDTQPVLDIVKGNSDFDINEGSLTLLPGTNQVTQLSNDLQNSPKAKTDPSIKQVANDLKEAEKTKTPVVIMVVPPSAPTSTVTTTTVPPLDQSTTTSTDTRTTTTGPKTKLTAINVQSFYALLTNIFNDKDRNLILQGSKSVAYTSVFDNTKKDFFFKDVMQEFNRFILSGDVQDLDDGTKNQYYSALRQYFLLLYVAFNEVLVQVNTQKLLPNLFKNKRMWLAYADFDNKTVLEIITSIVNIQSGINTILNSFGNKQSAQSILNEKDAGIDTLRIALNKNIQLLLDIIFENNKVDSKDVVALAKEGNINAIATLLKKFNDNTDLISFTDQLNKLFLDVRDISATIPGKYVVIMSYAGYAFYVCDDALFNAMSDLKQNKDNAGFFTKIKNLFGTREEALDARIQGITNASVNFDITLNKFVSVFLSTKEADLFNNGLLKLDRYLPIILIKDIPNEYLFMKIKNGYMQWISDRAAEIRDMINAKTPSVSTDTKQTTGTTTTTTTTPAVVEKPTATTTTPAPAKPITPPVTPTTPAPTKTATSLLDQTNAPNFSTIKDNVKLQDLVRVNDWINAITTIDQNPNDTLMSNNGITTTNKTLTSKVNVLYGRVKDIPLNAVLVKEIKDAGAEAYLQYVLCQYQNLQYRALNHWFNSLTFTVPNQLKGDQVYNVLINNSEYHEYLNFGKKMAATFLDQIAALNKEISPESRDKWINKAVENEVSKKLTEFVQALLFERDATPGWIYTGSDMRAVAANGHIAKVAAQLGVFASDQKLINFLTSCNNAFSGNVVTVLVSDLLAMACYSFDYYLYNVYSAMQAASERKPISTWLGLIWNNKYTMISQTMAANGKDFQEAMNNFIEQFKAIIKISEAQYERFKFDVNSYLNNNTNKTYLFNTETKFDEKIYGSMKVTIGAKENDYVVSSQHRKEYEKLLQDLKPDYILVTKGK